MKWAPLSLFSFGSLAWGTRWIRFLALCKSFPLQMNAR
jgi:hypothetical protein